MTRPISIIKTVIVVLFFCTIAIYSLFQAHKLIKGPIIEITSPENGSSFTSPLVEIRGKAKNISHLNLNQRKIYTDTQGVFSEKILLSPGYNIIILDAKDKFDKTTEKRLELILHE
jgi:hypothetical protein